MVVAAFAGSLLAMGFVLLISFRVSNMSLLVVCGILIGDVYKRQDPITLNIIRSATAVPAPNNPDAIDSAPNVLNTVCHAYPAE